MTPSGFPSARRRRLGGRFLRGGRSTGSMPRAAAIPMAACTMTSTRRTTTRFRRGYRCRENDRDLGRSTLAVNYVIRMVDGEHLLAIQSHVNECLVLLWKPEP